MFKYVQYTDFSIFKIFENSGKLLFLPIFWTILNVKSIKAFNLTFFMVLIMQKSFYDQKTSTFAYFANFKFVKFKKKHIVWLYLDIITNFKNFFR